MRTPTPRTVDFVVSVLAFLMAVMFFWFVLAGQADARVDPFGDEANSDLMATGDTGYSPEDWTFLIADYWTGPDFDRAMSIMECESAGNPNAVSDTNDHGLFQHNARYAPPRFEAVGYTWADRYDPEANVAAAYWLWERENWSPWTCDRLIGGGSDWFEPVTQDLLAQPLIGR